MKMSSETIEAMLETQIISVIVHLFAVTSRCSPAASRRTMIATMRQVTINWSALSRSIRRKPRLSPRKSYSMRRYCEKSSWSSVRLKTAGDAMLMKLSDCGRKK